MMDPEPELYLVELTDDGGSTLHPVFPSSPFMEPLFFIVLLFIILSSVAYLLMHAQDEALTVISGAGATGQSQGFRQTQKSKAHRPYPYYKPREVNCFGLDLNSDSDSD